MSFFKRNSDPCFARMLVATDFSAASEAAVRVAISLATTLGSQLLALHVFEYSDAGSPRTGGIVDGLFELRKSAERKLKERLRRASAQGLEVEAEMADGMASEAILTTIEEKGIDLAVMGTNATRGLERFIFGSTAEIVFRKARCPIVTVGPHASIPQEIHRGRPIVFATDFNLICGQAVRDAALLRQWTGSSLHCLHVLPQPRAGGSGEGLLRQTSEAALEWMVKESNIAGEAPECVITYGEVSTAVVDYARSHKAGLIVLGVRHASAMAAHLPAHIAYRVIAKAPCPVLTVPFDSPSAMLSPRSMAVSAGAAD